MFFATKEKQLYCSKSCFKKEYFRKKKLEGKDKFPIYICRECGKKVELSFDPLREPNFWDAFKCPFCHPESRNQIAIIITPQKILIAF